MFMTPMLAVPTLMLAMGLHGQAPVQEPANWRQFAHDHRAEITSIQTRVHDRRDARRVAHPMLSSENRAAVNAALEAGDYQAFLDATAQAPFAGKVTQEKFDAMVKARDLFVSGDKEAAKQVLIDAGIRKPNKQRLNHFTPNNLQH
jgi:hypothetical protein